MKDTSTGPHRWRRVSTLRPNDVIRHPHRTDGTVARVATEPAVTPGSWENVDLDLIDVDTGQTFALTLRGKSMVRLANSHVSNYAPEEGYR